MIILAHELVPTQVHFILIQSLVTNVLDFFFFNFKLCIVTFLLLEESETFISFVLSQILHLSTL